MSAFECNVTPTRIRNARKRNEDREPTIVDLRPFTGKCIVTFEDIPLTKIARRIVTVLNPFTETLKVTIVKKPKPEFNVSFEWTSHEIASEGSANLEVLWSPLKVVSCREVIEISDQFGNKKTVALILKSCELKKTIMRKTGGTDFNKKLKLKAPVTNVAMNRPKTVPISNSNCDEFSENYTAQGILPISMSPKRKILTINTTKSPLRNATNIQNNEDDSSLSKNQTPINTNALAIFDNIKFTPLTETKPKCESKLEYLTSLPTPIMSKRDDITLPKDILGRKNILQEMITPELITQQITEITRNEIYRPSKLDLEQEVQQIEDREHQTYIKLPSSEEINEIELVLTSNKNAIISKSQSLSTPPHQTELQKTFHVNKSLSFNENIVSDTFDCNRRLLSESMQNVESPAILEKEKLKKCIQGSMPNLNEICESNFEHNRYFNHQQSQPHIEMRAQNLSIESIVSNTDFKEIETCAQSSRLNLNEIGRPRKSSSPINPEMVILESPFKTQNNSQQYKKSKKSPTKFYLSPTIQRIREEEQEPLSPTAAKKLLTFSPPKSKISEINDIYRRETFVISKKGESRVTTWKQQQNQHMFAIPKVPRESIFRTTIASTISQSLTSLSSSITSIASTSSMPVTSGRLYNENFINAYSQKDPFSASTTEDPFLSSSMYLDEHTLDGIEKSFKKWLNALVTIPPDLETDRNEKIDVAKIFNEVQNKEISLPPTKETVCSQYYTARLDQLRSAAIRFFHSDIISKPLNKLSVIINEKKLLEVHSARSIHLDLVLQRSLLELLLCFNPLWLRIGLEVVFNVQLNLSSNQDIFGMCRFICTHMFRSQYLQQKYSKYHQQQELLDKLKKHTAKNFLFLIFFLDRAKETRLIKQNPCLFIKAAPYKETTEILKKFASLVLANYGDIIRMMKRIDYVLTHKQTVIDEFDFAFKNLAVDLRDGVRLTKVMEVILLRDDLVNKVRVPAISRLQKVHNVELAMKALESAEYKIIGNITSKDIADGHREKTLSLLWQIIYKFRAPRFNAAAKIIQKFWRNKWLKIVIEKRIKLKAEQKLNNAAIVIQKNFRGWKSRKLVKEYRERVIKAVVTSKVCFNLSRTKEGKSFDEPRKNAIH
ncbi:hypothetical protein PVAND_003573 [Polypedilum vanderplanki]|uniref:Calponin-homology (CH) domain-containing protein n=1 Tax=Polypedilum vanderplanki TaxID=319348 RepID=A0A9J6BUG7_POLVA|nr:hypothetical protein PVAND_003573 [Polypedilum vanderplanki]